MTRKDEAITICSDWGTDRHGRIHGMEVLYRVELHKSVSVYAPIEAADRRDFFKTLLLYVDAPCNIILAGDFNCVLNAADCSKCLRSDPSPRELQKLLRDFDLEDVKQLAGDKSERYTHWQGDTHARLDRIYVSSKFYLSNPRYQVQPPAISDHALVVVRLGKPSRRQKCRPGGASANSIRVFSKTRS